MTDKRRKRQPGDSKPVAILLSLLEMRTLRDFKIKNSLTYTDAIRHFMNAGGFADAVAAQQKYESGFADDPDEVR